MEFVVDMLPNLHTAHHSCVATSGQLAGKSLMTVQQNKKVKEAKTFVIYFGDNLYSRYQDQGFVFDRYLADIYSHSYQLLVCSSPCDIVSVYWWISRALTPILP